jgi:DNA-binding MarR family transcriptional regulator
MPKKKPYHPDSILEYMKELRKLIGFMTDWAEAVAKTMDIHPTDLWACIRLYDAGEMTAGDLAKAMGLTTGAMTTAISRLERAGLATRETDERDQRRVIVKPTKIPEGIIAVRDEIVTKIHPVFSRYTARELSRMVESTRKLAVLFEQEASRIKKATPKNKSRPIRNKRAR